MPAFVVETAQWRYSAIIQRGVLANIPQHLPKRHGKLFVVTDQSVWRHHGARIQSALKEHDMTVLFFTGGEQAKRLATVEKLAEQMIAAGGDRASVVIAFGGGIVNDVGGFLAAVFMRGIPVLQVPTTLLAQVDAGVGGKTGVNLVSGKNLIGSFHQPLAVLIDPDVLTTLPEREYHAGLFEVLKCGVIRSPELFRTLSSQAPEVLARSAGVLDQIIAESVRIKAEVVSADEKESDLRRILNFGHTIGHALEAETAYERFLHGEAIAFGMKAATHLAHLTGYLSAEDAAEILDLIARYNPRQPLDGIDPARLVARLGSDKKTVKGTVHFVLPETIGSVKVVSGLPPETVLMATRSALE